MAPPLRCADHEDRPAYILISRLEDGNTVALCEECWQAFLLAAVYGAESAAKAVAAEDGGDAAEEGQEQPADKPKPFSPPATEEQSTAPTASPASTASDERRGTRSHGRAKAGCEQSDGRPGTDLDNTD